MWCLSVSVQSQCHLQAVSSFVFRIAFQEAFLLDSSLLQVKIAVVVWSCFHPPARGCKEAECECSAEPSANIGCGHAVLP